MSNEDILKSALREIRRLYLRSNKRDRHTCYQMYLAADKALDEMEIRKLSDRLGEVNSVERKD